jgi:hypothetical protein
MIMSDGMSELIEELKKRMIISFGYATSGTGF